METPEIPNSIAELFNMLSYTKPDVHVCGTEGCDFENMTREEARAHFAELVTAAAPEDAAVDVSAKKLIEFTAAMEPIIDALDRDSSQGEAAAAVTSIVAAFDVAVMCVIDRLFAGDDSAKPLMLVIIDCLREAGGKIEELVARRRGGKNG